MKEKIVGFADGDYTLIAPTVLAIMAHEDIKKFCDGGATARPFFCATTDKIVIQIL